MNEYTDPNRQALGVLDGKKIPPTMKFIRARADWADIQRDMMLGLLTADGICQKYNLKKEDGKWAIMPVVKYTQWLREKHTEIFEQIEEQERRAIIGERLNLHREVVDKARASYDAAMTLCAPVKTSNRKNSKTEMRATPDFIAAREFLDVLSKSADKLGESFGIKDQPQQGHQPAVVQTFNLLALPKAENARPKVLDIAKSA